MAIIASTDIVSLAIVIGLLLFIDTLAYKTKRWVLYFPSLMLGLYTLGWTFFNASIVYSVVQTPGAATFTTYTIDANLFVVMLAVLELVTFLLFYEDVVTS